MPVAAWLREAEPSGVGFADEWRVEHVAAQPLMVEETRNAQAAVGLLEPGIAETQRVVVELAAEE